MDIVDELLKEKERRLKFFKEYKKHAKRIKEIARETFGDAKVYVFGSTVRGDYHPMLSDIDIAVVTECKDRRKHLEFKVRVSRISDVFEVHVLSEKEWNFYKRFIDEFVEV